MSGEVESAGGKSRSATVAPRYLFAQEDSRAEASAGAAHRAAGIVPLGSELAVAIEGQKRYLFGRCRWWGTDFLSSHPYLRAGPLGESANLIGLEDMLLCWPVNQIIGRALLDSLEVGQK